MISREGGLIHRTCIQVEASPAEDEAGLCLPARPGPERVAWCFPCLTPRSRFLDATHLAAKYPGS